MKCNNCDATISASAKFCPECGSKVEMQRTTCPNTSCGRTGLPKEAMFCPDCGTQLINGFASFTETVVGANFEMIAVKGGSFKMGSNDGAEDEKPVHTVTVNDFYMARTPVTVAQFKAFIDASAYTTDAEIAGKSMILSNKWVEKAGVNFLCDERGNVRNKDGYTCPVIHISWNDAVTFCKWLSKQTGKTYCLPTEAEWEYAAGASQTGLATERYKWAGTNKIEVLGDYAWYDKNSNNQIHPVGQKLPNSLGLYDMSGNVWEWCEDSYGNYGNTVSLNPICQTSGSSRVFRGGGWNGNVCDCCISTRNSVGCVDRGYISIRPVLVS